MKYLKPSLWAEPLIVTIFSRSWAKTNTPNFTPRFTIYKPLLRLSPIYDWKIFFSDLAKSAEYVPYLPTCDDVFITGIVARCIGTNHLYISGYRLQPTENYRWAACGYRDKKYMDTFYQGTSVAHKLWAEIHNPIMRCLNGIALW